MNFTHRPRAGGELAELVLDTIRSFPLSLDGVGDIVVHDTATGEDADAFARAYERTELKELEITAALDRDDHRCHPLLDPESYRLVILESLAWEAKEALGQTRFLEGMWRS
jgi:hypothetical protein